MSDEERRNPDTLPPGSHLFSRLDLYSSGYTPTCIYDYEFDGTLFKPETGKSWKTTKDGMAELERQRRLMKLGTKLYFIFYFDDYPLTLLTNLWDDTAGGFSEAKRFVVETHPKVIQRCLLLTTDPGDLVLDPTCGSGTTAFVAEQWGRRWITCDTSRVAITLAKQRLLTAVYDYYELSHPNEGVGSGFRYKKAPHITLGSIAQKEPPKEETLYDQPYIDKSRARVAGPFTVEAVPAPTVRSLEDIEVGVAQAKVQPSLADFRDAETPLLDASVARKGATLRHAEWRDELLKTGLRGKGGHHIDP
jgi:adenine-specific DNA-methyltransferase